MTDKDGNVPPPTKKCDVRVPQDATIRARLQSAAIECVLRKMLIPPVPLEIIKQAAIDLCKDENVDPVYQDFATIMLSNALWLPVVAEIPYERRILLLPQCLRDPRHCQGHLDSVGVLCADCGACPIGKILRDAEALGYVTLVAEGTTVVTALLEQGKIDAVIGVSCLNTLERAWQQMSERAIPGIAIPLLVDGCEHTRFDETTLLRFLHTRTSTGNIRQTEGLRILVDGWFTENSLAELLPGTSETESIARDWLAIGGKRWRPFLLATVAFSLESSLDEEIVRCLACAVECFHKASLAHDDIEDNDAERYDQPTLHRQHGTDIAINTGDLLVGEGYRLIGDCGAPDGAVRRMLHLAATAHRELTLGQGDELLIRKRKNPPTQDEMIRIFQQKTSPAFTVALRLGAVLADADDAIGQSLETYCAALGVAYQIHDDLQDTEETRRGQPSLILALALQTEPLPENDDWRHGIKMSKTTEETVRKRACQLREHYRHQAVRALAPIQNARVKTMLAQLAGRLCGPC